MVSRGFFSAYPIVRPAQCRFPLGWSRPSAWWRWRTWLPPSSPLSWCTSPPGSSWSRRARPRSGCWCWWGSERTPTSSCSGTPTTEAVWVTVMPLKCLVLAGAHLQVSCPWVDQLLPLVHTECDFLAPHTPCVMYGITQCQRTFSSGWIGAFCDKLFPKFQLWCWIQV